MTRESKKEKNKNNRIHNFAILIIKQIVAASIFFAFVLGMTSCDNTYISGYADALGLALQYDADWKSAVSSVSVWLKNLIPNSTEDNQSSDTSEPSPSLNEETIIFQ